MRKIAVVIPFYDGAAYLPSLIDSINDNMDHHYELRIFVIDNSVAAKKLPVSAQYKNTTVINAGEGLGYGKACNIGFKKSIEEQFDLLMIINQDGYLAKGALQKMISELETDDDFVATMPLLTEYGSDKVESFFTQVYLVPMPELVSDLFAGKTKSHYTMHTLCGACFLMKLNPVRHWPWLFDEIFHMYYEDVELYERWLNLGKKLILIPAAVFHHSHSNTNESIQTIGSMAEKRASHHIFFLKNKKTSISGWLLLEIRTFIGQLLKFEFKPMAVEFSSLLKVIKRSKQINKRRSGYSVHP